MRRFLFVIGFMLLTTLGFAGTALADTISDDFDPDINSDLWASIVNGTTNDNICGSVSGNALTFIGDDDSDDVPRSATTVELDTSGGGSVRFWLRISDDEDADDCEDANNEEGVYLEYSTGAGWVTIAYFDVESAPLFMAFTIPIPPAAQTGSTQFRWSQRGNDGGDTDHWALDNVEIDITSGGGGQGAPCQNMFDGRINNNPALDCAAPVVVYIAEDGTIDVYAVNPDTGEGTLVIRQAKITDFPTDGNEVLFTVTNPFTQSSIRLAVLTSGEFQLDAFYADGKPYIIVWATGAADLRHMAA